jgi:hypothetical protein
MTARRTSTAGPELVVACTLSSVDLASQARRWSDLRTRAEVRQLETPSGKRVYFRSDPGVVEELRELVIVENRCCSWATWTVELSAGEAVLDVTSTTHGVDAIRQMFTDSAQITAARGDNRD